MTTALLVIDMQAGMADRIASGRRPAVPEAPDRIARLLAVFRDAGLPVLHVHHDDPDPASPFRRDTPGGLPMECARPVAGEPVLWKSASSAFSGTGLDAHLRRIGVQQVVIAGAVAAFCVTSSTRAASDLGFRVILPRDALLAFDIAGIDGGRIDAATVMNVTLSLLGADFADVLRTDEIAARFGRAE
jgi:nicotinamidase-related amidase